MTANPKFQKQGPDFWATVKLLSQKFGYSKGGAIVVPTIEYIRAVFIELTLDISRIENEGQLTDFGKTLLEYFQFRADVLNNVVQHNLMDVDEAKKVYEDLREKHKPTVHVPKNKQTGDKAGDSYFTGIINILIADSMGKMLCIYDPRQITAFTLNNFPAKSLSRRMDGSYPDEINPIAVWEIKEYYFTTTFGSRIADGVYETMLDGYELLDAKYLLKRNVYHYLMIDSKRTWWIMGKSYLCRIIDMLHMNLITECIFGKEAVTRIPEIVPIWHEAYKNELAKKVKT